MIGEVDSWGLHPDSSGAFIQDADLMILGVSRSGKTPLCIYLGQRGYKVRPKLSAASPLNTGGVCLP